MPTKGCLTTSGMIRFAWHRSLEYVIKVIVITVIKGRALELDPGLRCLRIKTLSGVQKTVGLPEGLHSVSRIYGFFFLSRRGNHVESLPLPLTLLCWASGRRQPSGRGCHLLAK